MKCNSPVQVLQHAVWMSVRFVIHVTGGSKQNSNCRISSWWQSQKLHPRKHKTKPKEAPSIKMNVCWWSVNSLSFDVSTTFLFDRFFLLVGMKLLLSLHPTTLDLVITFRIALLIPMFYVSHHCLKNKRFLPRWTYSATGGEGVPDFSADSRQTCFHSADWRAEEATRGRK